MRTDLRQDEHVPERSGAAAPASRRTGEPGGTPAPEPAGPVAE
jgi:hypothetical protein